MTCAHRHRRPCRGKGAPRSTAFCALHRLLLDSEFTPAEGEDAAPRQADLSLTVGLSSLPKESSSAFASVPSRCAT